MGASVSGCSVLTLLIVGASRLGGRGFLSLACDYV